MDVSAITPRRDLSTTVVADNDAFGLRSSPDAAITAVDQPDLTTGTARIVIGRRRKVLLRLTRKSTMWLRTA